MLKGLFLRLSAVTAFIIAAMPLLPTAALDITEETFHDVVLTAVLDAQAYNQTDTTTGISLLADEGIVPTGSVLHVADMEPPDSTYLSAFRMSLQLNNAGIGLAGNVQIRIPLTAELRNHNLLVYLLDGEEKTKLPFEIQGDSLVITTSRLGTFALASAGVKPSDDKDNVKTGDSPFRTFSVLAGFSAFVLCAFIFALRKRNMAESSL